MQRLSFALVLAAHFASQQIMAGPVPGAGTNPVPVQDNAPPLTLTEALRLAKASNPSLGASRLQHDVAKGAAEQASKWSNPALEFSSEDIPADHGGLSAAQNMIGLSQTIPFPGKKRLESEIGRTSVAVADNVYLQHERELARAVKGAFFETLAAEKRVAVSEELFTLAQSLGDATRKRVAAGAAGRQEALRAEIESERVRVALSTARREQATSRKSLAQLLGTTEMRVVALEGTLRETSTATGLKALRERGLAHHPELRAALANRDRSQLAVERAQREPRPDVTLGLAAGRNGATEENLMEFRVSLPLPLLDRSQGRKRETAALAAIAELEVTAMEQKLAQELGTAEARYHAASEQVELYRHRILPKTEEALKLVRGGFEAGKFGFLDLVDTQRTAVESRLEYVDKLLELNLAIADLESLVGMEWVE